MNLVVSHVIPPIYGELKKKFGVNWDKDLIIAWDGKIHSKGDIWPQKIVHEQVHLKQQEKLGNEAWWKLYLESDVFRFQEELLAYRAEANFIKKYIKNREDKFHIIREIAKNFSGETYGNLVNFDEAMKLIQ